MQKPDNHKGHKIQKDPRIGRMRRLIIALFLAVSLIPLISISLLNIQTSKETLRENSEEFLTTQSHAATSLVEHYISGIVEQLRFVMRQKRSADFLSALDRGIQRGNQSAHEYVQSYQHARLLDQYGDSFQMMRYEKGFHDLFLIDNRGNILFSLAEEEDLGSNLITGRYSHTRFAQAVERTLKTGQLSFSGFEHYQPSNGIISGFFAAPVIDDAGEKIGAIALQIESIDLLKMIGAHASSGCATYLINEAGKLRSPACITENYLEYKVPHQLVSDWLAGKEQSHPPEDEHEHEHENQHTHIEAEGTAHDSGHEPESATQRTHHDHVSTYTTPTGEQVVGLIHEIQLLDKQWAVVVQMPVSEAFAAADEMQRQILLLTLLTIVLVVALSIPISRSIVRPVSKLTDLVERVRIGELDQRVEIENRNEMGVLGDGVNNMLDSLQKTSEENEHQQWKQQGASTLSEATRGDQSMDQLSCNIMGALCRYLSIEAGALYLATEQQIELAGSYSLTGRQQLVCSYGEGVIGQAAADRKVTVINNLPDDYLLIRTGLGQAPLKHLLIYPIIKDKRLVGLLELVSLTEISAVNMEFIQWVSPQIAIMLQTTTARDHTKQLLLKTQQQAAELETREVELREKQSILEEKNEQLNIQQDQLRKANDKLEVRAEELEVSKQTLEERNNDLHKATAEISKRAEELKQASRYKSQFLSNMSHELRTPLNSLLILAKLLADNKHGNLSEQQQQYATTIHDSGTDLLRLINDILDMSKIEAGKMEVNYEQVYADDFTLGLVQKFRPMAEDKGIDFSIEQGEIPAQWYTDGQKVGQILKNLISNALKFTSEGGVTLSLQPHPPLDGTQHQSLALSVKDTGIGIPKEKRKLIFSAFQQADGDTSRRFGGTGLGLTISRQLSELLGGKIEIESEEGRGSTFTLIIPVDDSSAQSAQPEKREEQIEPTEPAPAEPQPSEQHAQHPESAPEPESESESESESHDPEPGQEKREPPSTDDRDTLQAGDDQRSILIIEDDLPFSTLLKSIARKRSFKVLVAGEGKEGLYLANHYQPSGIILDLGLPDMSGEVVMRELKDNLDTRHIPIHILSAREVDSELLRSGALGFQSKPGSRKELNQMFEGFERVVNNKIRRLLLIMAPDEADEVTTLIEGRDLSIHQVDTLQEARAQLESDQFDTVMMTLEFSDSRATELLEWMRNHEEPTISALPAIVYCEEDLSPDERDKLNRYAQSVIHKRDRSDEVILDQSSLFLHRLESNLPESQRQIVRMLHDNEAVFENRKVLIVDDDMRNIFALTASLKDRGLSVVAAKNGREGLEKLEQNEDIDLVLMDIMMPEMDGYEAMRAIRAQDHFEKLPVIALTAKAMKGDRSLCIEAGASDYLPKPVDMERLFSMMRVWLYK